MPERRFLGYTIRYWYTAHDVSVCLPKSGLRHRMKTGDGVIDGHSGHAMGLCCLVYRVVCVALEACVETRSQFDSPHVLLVSTLTPRRFAQRVAALCHANQ